MATKLKFADIRKPLPFTMNSNTSVWIYLKHILDKDYTIDFDVYLPSKKKNLQRKLCWKIEQKQELILSMLKGINIPPISVIQYTDDYKNRDKKIFKIIDGKQRLSSMLSFLKGEFYIVWDDNTYFFENLDDDAKRAIECFCVVGNVAYEYPDAMISDDDKIRWFELINFAGTPQDVKHLNNLKSQL